MDGPFDKASLAGAGGGFLDAPTAWYRKTFTVPESDKGKQISILFDGVYMNSDMYLNGKKLGNHPYGYTPFQYDLTKDLNYGKPNTLAVRCEVTQPCSRWYSGAGIFRHVYLVTTGPVHVAPWGSYWTSEKTGDDEFTVTTHTILKNDSDKEAKCKAVTAIEEVGVKGKASSGSGKKVAEATSNEETIPAGGEAYVTATCKVPSAKLWSVDSPFMYRAETKIDEGEQNGRCGERAARTADVRIHER